MENIRYRTDDRGFLKDLRSEVSSCLSSGSSGRFADYRFYLKAFFFISLYITLYLTFVISGHGLLAFICYVLMGPVAIFLGLNLAHDAAHGSISSRKWVNRTCLLAFDLLGANSYMWKKRHVYSHHSFPNVAGQDADLKQSPLIRIFPGDPLKKFQRFQHLYMPFVYLFYTANWLLFRDFEDFTKKRIGSFRPGRHSGKELLKLLLLKSMYLAYILIIPFLIAEYSWFQIVAGFLLMNWAASITISLALLPAHVADTSKFPLPDSEGQMKDSWPEHQVKTTTDYATKHLMINFLMGGFNHHVTHHLFPDVCHVHYRKITPIVKMKIEQYDLVYNYEGSLWNAYRAHFKLLKNRGWEEWNKQLGPEL